MCTRHQLALAWLLSFTALSESRRTRLVQLGCAGYAGLVAVSLLQTFAGLAPWDLSLGAGGLLMASVAALGGAFAVALLALRRATLAMA